jgi:hypothetical protein
MNHRPAEHTDRGAEEQAAAQGEQEPRRVISCANCGYRITHPEERIHVHGAHEHVFTNPGGYVYRIGCFGGAPGCAEAGPETEEFTWFRGYRWRYAGCAACHTHLGWAYRRGSSTAFYGLIRGRLVE